MKKYVLVFIISIFVLFLGALNIYAVGNNVTISVSSSDVKPGDTFKLEIKVDCEEDFQGLTGVLNYDKDKLEIVGDPQNGSGMGNLNSLDVEGNYVVSVIKNSLEEATKLTCQTITFKVKSNVTDGEQLQISLTNIEMDPTPEQLSAKIKITVSNSGETEEPGTEDPGTEEPEPLKQKEYTLTEDNMELKFTDEEGHNFVVTVDELWNLTDTELLAKNITKDEYTKGKEKAEKLVKDYGTIVNVYDIKIADGQVSHTGEAKIKLKITDKMKKTSTYKLICIDNDSIKSSDVVELKVEGDYLVGTLKHLSNYALVETPDPTISPNPVNKAGSKNMYLLFSILSVITMVSAVSYYKYTKIVK